MFKDHSGALRGRKPHISGLLPALVHAIKKYFCSDISIWQPKAYDQISFRHTSGQRHSGAKRLRNMDVSLGIGKNEFSCILRSL